VVGLVGGSTGRTDLPLKPGAHAAPMEVGAKDV
jgi:hypothetical protein